jgi:superoxide dismutase
MVKRRPNGFLATKEDVVRELKTLMQERNFKRIPTSTELCEMGQSTLAGQIYIKCGGFVKLRGEFGEEILKKRGMWTPEYTREQVLSLMKEQNLQTLPSQKRLNELGRCDLASAIAEHAGGFNQFRRTLGESSATRPYGSLQNRKYILGEVKRIMRENKFTTLPTQTQLAEIGESSIAIAISHHHGGFTNFRKAMGEDNIRAACGTWRDKEYALAAARRVLSEHKLTTLPNNITLRKMGYTSLSSAITKYHGGYIEFRKLLGEDEKTAMGVWRDLSYVKDQAHKIMQEQDTETLPGSHTLIKLGYGSLVTSIHAYHGGMRNFRKLLGQEQIVAQVGSWQNLDYAIEQAQEFLGKHPEYTTIPSHELLIKCGYSTLSSAIVENHGGFVAFRKILTERLNLPSEVERTTSLLESWVKT